jgi:hypothetical protein
MATNQPCGLSVTRRANVQNTLGYASCCTLNRRFFRSTSGCYQIRSQGYTMNVMSAPGHSSSEHEIWRCVSMATSWRYYVSSDSIVVFSVFSVSLYPQLMRALPMNQVCSVVEAIHI